MDEEARKQQLYQLARVSKSEAIHLIGELTLIADSLVEFSQKYGVEGLDAFLMADKQVRASLFACVESIENDQELLRGEQE